MLSIEAENGALLATAAAATQSWSAMADDCRAHLLVLHAELDEAYYDQRINERAPSTGWVLAGMRTRTRVDRGPSSRRLNTR